MMMSMSRPFHALLVLATLTAPSSAQTQTAPAPETGTYSVRLCAQPCATTVTALFAVVVLLDDAVAVVEPARSALAALERVEYWSPVDRQRAVNACFKVTRRDFSLGSDHFGITPKGSTRWQHSAAEGFSLLVFQSIDANYKLKWTAPGLLTRGEGWASGPGPRDGVRRDAYFEATRLGPPDVSQCR
jgi:hypothetical protein